VDGGSKGEDPRWKFSTEPKTGLKIGDGLSTRGRLSKGPLRTIHGGAKSFNLVEEYGRGGDVVRSGKAIGGSEEKKEEH